VSAPISLRIKQLTLPKSQGSKIRANETRSSGYIDMFFTKGFGDGETALSDWMGYLDGVGLE
jgi:hypothetical protein